MYVCVYAYMQVSKEMTKINSHSFSIKIKKKKNITIILINKKNHKITEKTTININCLTSEVPMCGIVIIIIVISFSISKYTYTHTLHHHNYLLWQSNSLLFHVCNIIKVLKQNKKICLFFVKIIIFSLLL